MPAPVVKLRPEEIRRLLVIKRGGVGTTVLLIPALRALRSALPRAEIDWLISPPLRPLAGLVPYVDNLIEAGKPSALNFIRLAAKLRGRHFDAVVDFEARSWLTVLLAWISGAPVRLGFFSPGQLRAKLFTEKFWRYFAQHESQEFLSLSGMLTPIVFDPSLELWESDDGRDEVDRLALKRLGDGPLVVLHPACGKDGLPREWPLGNYAVLANWLIKKHGAHVLITGGPDERKKTADLQRLLNGQARDLGGQLSLRGMISLLNRVDLVVSGNNGVMHLAAALRRRQVALHGPTDVRLRGPSNTRARVVKTDCSKCPCLRFGHEYHRKDQACMARISVESVKAAVEALFDNAGDI
jgi:lipopolysaccharide heptosyltransferase II